jgi:hypothetical protein
LTVTAQNPAAPARGLPLSSAAAERYGADPLATLPLSKLHPCARARLAFKPHGAEPDGFADYAAKLMTDAPDWQPFLEAVDRRRVALAAAYRRLLALTP